MAQKNQEKDKLARTRPEPAAARVALKPKLTFATGAVVTLATGPAPAPVAGFALSGCARYGNWAASLEPQVTLPSSKADSNGNSVRIWSYGAESVRARC